MVRFIQSLSLGSGALLIAIVSSASVWFLGQVAPSRLRKLWVIAIPAILTFCLYWFPVWFAGEPALEYHTWQFVFYVLWFLAGAIPSALVVRFVLSRSQ